MNCAVVTIGSQKKLAKRSLSGPNMFIANIGNGCSTAAGTDVVFPNPGSNIVYGGDPSKRAAPVGNCGPVLVTPPPPPSTSPGDTGGGDTGGTADQGSNGKDLHVPLDIDRFQATQSFIIYVLHGHGTLPKWSPDP